MNKINLKKLAKKLFGFFLKFLFLDTLIFLTSKILYFFTKLLFLKEWYFNSSEIPFFFKHQINYGLWRFKPSEWTFTLRGVYAREQMHKNCKVLDLCCGDGSYSYLFFSDIASKIDAIDYDKSAIKYAKQNFKSFKINYERINIINEVFPSIDYDIIVWNAGICYFTSNEIDLVIKKIIKCSAPGMILCGMLPKANGHIDHKTEFENINSVYNLFDLYFNLVKIKEVNEDLNDKQINFYFTVSDPKINVLTQ